MSRLSRERWAFFLILLCPGVQSQGQARDGCEDCTVIRPHVAAAEIVGTNALAWSYSFFLKDAYWAHVRPADWKDNVQSGLEWDANRLTSNQMMHPLHGAMYFNAARSNGYGYLGSMLASLAGSLMWEFMGEIHSPSANDLFATTVGGSALGEIMHRMSSALKNSESSASFLTGVGAALINPMGLVTDVIGGRAVIERQAPHSIRVRTYAGFDYLTRSGEILDQAPRPVLGVNVQYGDATTDAVERPFDVAELGIRFGRGLSSGREYGKENPVDVLETRGALATFILSKGRSAIGVYQHLDYFRSPSVEFGGQSLAVAFHRQDRISKALWWSSSAHLGVLVLGSSPSRLIVQPHRINDYGPGLSMKVDARVSTLRADLFKVHARLHWLRSISHTNGRHLVLIGGATLKLPLPGGFAAGLATEVSRHSSSGDALRTPPAVSTAVRLALSWTSASS